jgi:hypothetical protein
MNVEPLPARPKTIHMPWRYFYRKTFGSFCKSFFMLLHFLQQLFFMLRIQNGIKKSELWQTTLLMRASCKNCCPEQNEVGRTTPVDGAELVKFSTNTPEDGRKSIEDVRT